MTRTPRLASLVLGALLAAPAVALATPSDPALNHPLSVASRAQDQLAGVRDAAGRPVFVWRDQRESLPGVFAQRLLANYEPAWATDGAPVMLGLGAHDQPQLVPAGADVIVVWRTVDTDAGDITATRWLVTGGAPWPTGRVAICAAPGAQASPRVVSDEAGGAIVAWTDLRSDSAQVYAQRVDGDGNVLWTPNGVALRSGVGSGTLVALVADGAGGAIAAWSDARGGYWAQRVDGGGNVAWAADGVNVCLPGPPKSFVAVPDGAYGLIAAFEKTDGTGFYRDLYAQRLLADGSRAWPDSGVIVCRARFFQRTPALVSDGAGGAIATWDDSRTFHFAEVYAQRIDGTGAALWTADGVRLCGVSMTAAKPVIASDGANGAIVGWQDDRSGGVDLYAQRVSALGVPLWTADGVPVSTAPDTQSAAVVLADGAGGATFAWVDGRNPPVLWAPDLYVQNVNADGTLDSTHVGGAPLPTGATLALAPPSPNPAGRSMRVAWTLASPARVRVSVLDLQGREVRRLADGEFGAGAHAVTWDLADAHGSRVSAGVWLLKLDAGGRTAVRRAVTLR